MSEVNTSSPANGVAPASAATPVPPSTDAGAAPAPETTELTVVQISKADLDALIAAAAAKSATSTPAVKPPVPRVTTSTAKKIGDMVTHNGRLAQITDVLTTARDIGGDQWKQILYKVGVFAEEHIVDAEDVGKAS